MRILLVSDYYPPLIGGTELEVKFLSQELVKRGHEVRVATIWQRDTLLHENQAGVLVERLKGLTTTVPWFSKDPGRRHIPPVPDPLIVSELRRIVTEFRPHVVHAFCWIAYSCAAALLGKRIPLVISLQEYGYVCPTRTLLYHDKICQGPALGKCLECATQRYGPAKAMVAVGGVYAFMPLLRHQVAGVHGISSFVQETVGNRLLGHDSSSRALQVTFAPLQLRDEGEEEFPESQADEFFHQLPEKFILYVGSLQPHKGLRSLLEAYSFLERRPPLVLLGHVWPDTPREFPSGVTVVQNVPHPLVMAAWERCLFGVAPSIWAEPFGAVVAEAMIKGKAVIGSKPGGHADMIIDGETGLLVDAGDVRGLVRAMQRLSDNPELCNKLGLAARERAEREFTAATLLPRFEKLYAQVQARPSAIQRLVNDAPGG